MDITLVSHVRNEAALRADPIAGMVTLCCIDNEALARPLHKLSKLLRSDGLSWTIGTALGWPSYMLFEYKVYQQFKQALTADEFDVVHRVTPLSPTMGSPLAKWIKTPMVLGPINGGLPWPKDYPELRAQEKEWLVPLRKAYRLLPYFRSTYKHLKAVIAGSKHTATEIPAVFRGQTWHMPENGIDPAKFTLGRVWQAPSGRFRFITVGRLVPYKGVDLVLEAMAGSDLLRQAELLVVGDGPQRQALEKLAQQRGLGDAVRFAGWVQQTDLAAEMQQAHALAFPSLREFGGGVVLEAMASGLPCVIVDYGGPAELVDEQCGILVNMAPREVLIANVRKAMEAMVQNHAMCAAMSLAAIAKVRANYLWSVKAGKVVDIYRTVLAGKNYNK
ncbi:glycosyltransferase family 4 protein [Curvibacter sp. CHRR-16]|uniref:glycosyltransferase family 4 protein n=1 Tax=Curvibacter sp. CHRR-16 TaxID=2835872 RepID=UPI001BDA7D45|nr:glycosyltransferase family 4 protein [Curvibacter sp. CHRR-16]MBT0571520.1 glycosyltransferase family 4 protein [Curvibacter sp. CHRR-16]